MRCSGGNDDEDKQASRYLTVRLSEAVRQIYLIEKDFQESKPGTLLLAVGE
jgi:hypothetical protein